MSETVGQAFRLEIASARLDHVTGRVVLEVRGREGGKAVRRRILCNNVRDGMERLAVIGPEPVLPE